MRPDIFDRLGALEPALCRAPGIWLGMDFDGTLCALRETPDSAHLDGATRDALEHLASHPSVRLAVISGRSLEDVRRKVGVDRAAYAGNHGLEIAGPGLSRVHRGAVERLAALDRLMERIEKRLAGVPGLLIERKGLTASVHVRLVPAAWRPAVRWTVVKETGSSPDFVVHHGASVWEVRPDVRWGKGFAARWLLGRQAPPGAAAIYIGDDRTDEDAFRALAGHVTIRVGTGRATAANFTIASVREVLRLLTWILRIRPPAAPDAGSRVASAARSGGGGGR